MSKPVSIGRATLLRKSEKASQFKLWDYDGRVEYFPNSSIHDNSEVYERSPIGSQGELVLHEWILVKKGMI